MDTLPDVWLRLAEAGVGSADMGAAAAALGDERVSDFVYRSFFGPIWPWFLIVGLGFIVASIADFKGWLR